MNTQKLNTYYKGIIFDLDGTLINSLKDLADSVNKVLQEYELPTHDLEKYKKFVGNGISKLIERALPQDRFNLHDEALRKFRKIYEIHQLDNTKPYPQIDELLNKLSQKGIKIGICTNKHDAAAKEIVAKLFPNFHFDYIIGDLPNIPRKPNPIKLFNIAEKLQMDTKNIIYVGDSDVDMQTGVNAKMFTIGVLWGFRDEYELKNNGADILVDNPLQILDIISEK